MESAVSRARLPALYAPALRGRTGGEVVRLDPAEARHTRVLRLSPDSEVVLTDGRGGLWRARLGRPERDMVSACLLEPLTVPERLPLELAFAVGNKTHTLWLVEKAVEFGAARLQPIEFSHSRSVADAARSPNFWRKAERRAVAALKQSTGAWLPEFERVVGLGEYLEGVAELPADSPRVLLDPAGEPLRRLLREWDGEGLARILIGPEGGVEPDEQLASEACGFHRGSLASGILRFETAAVAAMAVAVQQTRTSRGGKHGIH